MPCSNFTKQEQLILLEEIRKYRDILENKKTNKITSRQKLDAWNKVSAGFNSQVLFKRSSQQLQAKYENLISETREVAAAERWGAAYYYRLRLQGTGGGPINITDDPIYSIILDLVNYITVIGMESLYDSDALEIPMYDGNSRIKTAKPSTTDKEAEEDLENQPSSLVTSAILESVASCSQVSENLKPAANEIVTNPVPALEVHKIIESDNCSHYTPRTLRKHVSKSLRPKVTSLMPEWKEKYYQAKTRFKEKQIECVERSCQREAEEHAKRLHYLEERNQREKESHKRKIELMELEIKKIRESNM